MKWEGNRQSENVEDRRSQGPTMGGRGIGFGGGRGIGLGTIVIAQRSGWFKRGLASGRMGDCNTFDAARL